jgi:glutathione S-transferase
MSFKIIGNGMSPFVRKTRAYFAEKGLEYEHEDLIPMNVPAAYKEKSPLGKIPCLEHDGRFLPDSSVICAYVERLHPKPALYPSAPWDYARALWLEEYADGALVAAAVPIFQERVLKKLFGNETDEARVEKTATETLPPFLDYLEGQIGDAQFLVGGSLTVADLAVASPFCNLTLGGWSPDAKRWPNLVAYLERIHARPSFKPLIEQEKAGLPF